MEQMPLLPAARLAVLYLHACCFSWGGALCFLTLLCCLSSDLLELRHLSFSTEEPALCCAGAEAPLQITAFALAAWATLGRKACKWVFASLSSQDAIWGWYGQSRFSFGWSWEVFTPPQSVSDFPDAAFLRATVLCFWEISLSGQSQICSLSRTLSQGPLKLATVFEQCRRIC